MNDLAKLLCEFAREAGMRANCEQIAAELPTPGVTDDTGETTENKKVTRTADVRIEAEEGHPVTWIDVAAHCSMQSCRGNPKPNKAGRAARQGEQAKYRQCGLTPKDPTRKEGRMIPAIFEPKEEWEESSWKNSKDGPRNSRRNTMEKESSKRA